MQLPLRVCIASLLAFAPALLAQGNPPTIDAGGVVNAADYTTAVAPGAIVAIYGTDLSTNVVSAASTPLPVLLDGTSVEVDGQPIPLFFVSPRQVNAQMPFGLSGVVQVRVRTAAGLSAPQDVTLVPRAPRLFTTAMDGKGDAILCHGADWSIVSSVSPAQPGEYLIMFLTGLGAVAPAIPAGQAGGDNGQLGPLNQLPPGTVTVAIGGKPAEVAFAGLAPTFVGLYQLNIRVPDDIPGGTFAVVVSTTDGISQPLVRVASGGISGPPVPGVNYEDVQVFLARLNARNDGYVYRMPTEAEWEYAARAETTGIHYAALNEIAWYADNSGRQIQPVGRKRPNVWGLYDMIGNAVEWCQDWLAMGYYWATPEDDPQGPDSSAWRVLRGGGASGVTSDVRTSKRWGFAPGLRGGDFGVRLVRVPKLP